METSAKTMWGGGRGRQKWREARKQLWSPKVLQVELNLVEDKLGQFYKLKPTGWIVLAPASGMQGNLGYSARLQGSNPKRVLPSTQCSEDTTDRGMPVVWSTFCRASLFHVIKNKRLSISVISPSHPAQHSFPSCRQRHPRPYFCSPKCMFFSSVCFSMTVLKLNKNALRYL